jgi:site-specific DNA recombinase
MAFAVAAYITGAYWFTASTSFANPAVTIARSFSDTFAGIRPVDAPGFIAALFFALPLAMPCLAVALKGSPGEQARAVRELVEKVLVADNTIMIRVRRRPLVDWDVASSGSEDPIALTGSVAFKRRGVETKLVLPGLAQQKHSSRGDPVLIKAIARGRAWFEELASGRARSLQELASRDGISRRYIRRLICLAFLSPELVEASLQGRQPVTLTATRLTELDLPLDWTEQHRLLAS